MLSNHGKFTDRNPDTVAAGKFFTQGDKAKDCLNIQIEENVSDPVHKFRCTTKPEPAQRRIFYGRYSDPDIASLLSHGVNTKPSYMAKDLVNPRPKSFFVQRLKDKKEDIYLSKQKAPIGKSHDQRFGLPNGVEPYDVRYGLKIVKDCTAGELVSPPKSYKQVDQEGKVGLDLYKKSHSAYETGEMYDRGYNWSRVPKTSMFGVETPHDNRGTNVQKTLKWLHETEKSKSALVVSKRVDDFRERTQPRVEKVHDAIKDTLHARIGPDHTFGVLFRPDEYGAGDLIHNRTPGNYLRGKERERGVVAAIRQHLKKANYHNFHDLNAAFKFYDKDGSGKIDIVELREICLQFNLPIEKELFEALFEYCDADKDGQIDYSEFSNFLNWKDKLPVGIDSILRRKAEEKTSVAAEEKSGEEDTEEQKVGETEQEKPMRLRKQVDDAAVEYTPSSKMINAVIGGVTTQDWKTHGIPTVRSDLPAPRIRRIGDPTNYGDESDAYGLTNLSIYSNHGIYERDFFQPRDQNEIRRIFDSVGYGMTNETFQQLWSCAREKSNSGEVSVETFRQILDEAMQPSDDVDKTNNDQKPSCTNNKRPDVYKTIDALYKRKEQDVTVKPESVIVN
eukprot:gene17678-19442_t